MRLLMYTLTLLFVQLCVAAPFLNHPPDEEGGGEKEQRELDFPNTSVIPGDLTEELGVDFFFSLWTVLQDEDITTSDVPFTILAPSNLAKRPSQSVLGSNEKLKKLILRHIILGTKVLSADVISSNSTVSQTALDETNLQFSHSTSGILVNTVRALRSDVFVPQGTIIVLEDYLVDPKDELEEGQIPMIELGTQEEAEAPMKLEDIDLEFGKRVFEAMSNETKPFYEELIDVLSLLRSGTSEFRRYFLQANISQYFTNDGEYTAFIPMDDAFQKWYPIDWGFNPFEVPHFVKTTILNHIVVGKVKQHLVKDGGILTTLGGKQIIIKKNAAKGLSLNGVPVFEGDTPTSHGSVWFVRDILFVDSTVVRSLQIQNKDKETAPLVTFPWYNSQYLSHVFTELEDRKEFNFLVDCLNRTNEFADDLPSHDANFSMIRYTFFAPNDAGFKKSMTSENFEAINSDDAYRKQLLMDHTVNGRFYSTDLVDGASLETISGKSLNFTQKDGKLFVNQIAVLDADIYIYNLGNMIIIDGVLFAATDNNMELVSADDVEMTATEIPAELPTDPSMEESLSRSTRQAPGGSAVFARSEFLNRALTVLQTKGNDYGYLARYLTLTPNLEENLLNQGTSFTLFAPNNFGFRRWFLADAAEPFLVSGTARKNMLLDLIVKGKISQKDLVNGASFTTIGGKTFTVNTADGSINLSDRSRVTSSAETNVGEIGNIIEVDSSIFVDFAAMEKAVSEHHRKNPSQNPFGLGARLPPAVAINRPRVRSVASAVVDPKPAPAPEPAKIEKFSNSPFLAAVLSQIEKKNEFASFRRHLERTPELENDVIAAGNGDFTLIAPTNFGIIRWQAADAADPYYVSNALRKQMLSDQIVVGKMSKADLVDGAKLTTLSGKTIDVKVADGVISLGDRATVQSTDGLDAAAPYIVANSIVFVDFEGMRAAIKEYSLKNPSQNPFGLGARLPPAVAINQPRVRSVASPVVDPKPAPAPEPAKIEKFSNSPFLAAVLSQIEKKNEFASFQRHLERTPELENDVIAAGNGDFTLIAPTNFGIRRWQAADAADPYYVSNTLRKQMLSDQIVVGKMSKADLVDGAKLTTLSGKTIDVKVADGVISLGDRATVQSTDGLDATAPYIVANSIVFVDFEGMRAAIKEYSLKNPLQGPFGRPLIPPSIPAQGPAVKSTALFAKSPFLAAFVANASCLQAGEGRAFMGYLETTPELQELVQGSDYTLVVPSNFGFRRWFMADAVDPLYVNKNLRKTVLLDHIIKGKLTVASLVDGAKLETLSGKMVDVKVSEGVISIGDRATVTSTAGLDGETLYLSTDSMIIVDFDAMSNAVKEHYQKNPPVGPLGVAAPVIFVAEGRVVREEPVLFEKSKFLTKAYNTLQNKDDFATFRRYLETTADFEDELKNAGEDYTMVIPENFGIIRWLVQDTADPFSVSPDLRKELLSDHVIIGKIGKSALANGATLQTLSGKKVEVKIVDGSISVGDRATVTSVDGLEDSIAPYFTTDSMLFVNFDGMQEALRLYHKSNPRRVSPLIFSAPEVEERVVRAEPVLFAKSAFLKKAYNSLENREDYATFRRYLETSEDFQDQLKTAGEEYTMVIPDNFGIIRWLLQDTADPFSVSSGLRMELLADHVLKGKIGKSELANGTILETLSGKKVEVKVVDGSISLGDRATVTSVDGLEDSVAPYFTTNSMLFVDFGAMQEALRVYHETHPAVSPWSHLQQESISVTLDVVEDVHPFVEKVRAFLKEEKQDVKFFEHYFETSPVSRKLKETESGAAEYTIFVPESFGITRFLPQDTADVFEIDDDFRSVMILDHIVRQRIEKKDLVDGAKFESVSGKTIEVKIDEGSELLNNRGRLLSGPESLGSGGVVYVVDSLLDYDPEGMSAVLRKHASEISSPFIGASANHHTINVDGDGVAGTS